MQKIRNVVGGGGIVRRALVHKQIRKGRGGEHDGLYKRATKVTCLGNLKKKSQKGTRPSRPPVGRYR